MKFTLGEGGNRYRKEPYFFLQLVVKIQFNHSGPKRLLRTATHLLMIKNSYFTSSIDYLDRHAAFARLAIIQHHYCTAFSKSENTNAPGGLEGGETRFVSQ